MSLERPQLKGFVAAIVVETLSHLGVAFLSQFVIVSVDLAFYAQNGATSSLSQLYSADYHVQSPPLFSAPKCSQCSRYLQVVQVETKCQALPTL